MTDVCQGKTFEFNGLPFIMSFLFSEEGLVETRSVRNVIEVSTSISPLCLEIMTKKRLECLERPFKTSQSSWTLHCVLFNSTSEADIKSMFIRYRLSIPFQKCLGPEMFQNLYFLKMRSIHIYIVRCYGDGTQV